MARWQYVEAQIRGARNPPNPHEGQEGARTGRRAGERNGGSGDAERQRRAGTAKGGRHAPTSASEKLRKISRFATLQLRQTKILRPIYLKPAARVFPIARTKSTNLSRPTGEKPQPREHPRRPQPDETHESSGPGQVRDPVRGQPVDAGTAAAKTPKPTEKHQQTAASRARTKPSASPGRGPDADPVPLLGLPGEHRGERPGERPRRTTGEERAEGRPCCNHAIGGGQEQRGTETQIEGLGAQGGRVAVWRKTPKPAEKHQQTAAGAPGRPGL